jgi:hypothetical protein
MLKKSVKLFGKIDVWAFEWLLRWLVWTNRQ